METIDISKGDVTDVILARPTYNGVPDAIPGTFVCKTNVTDLDGVQKVTARVVTDKETIDSKEYFKVAITPTETAGLTLGSDAYTDFIWVIELSDSSISYKREIKTRLRVRFNGIS